VAPALKNSCYHYPSINLALVSLLSVSRNCRMEKHSTKMMKSCKLTDLILVSEKKYDSALLQMRKAENMTKLPSLTKSEA
jgi:hypothetical protein